MKKLTAILLILMLTAALFTGCMNAKLPEPKTSADKEPAATKAAAATDKVPATDAPAETDKPAAPDSSADPAPSTDTPTDTHRPVHGNTDGATLLAEAGRKLAEAKSLRYHMEISEEISSEGIHMTFSVQNDGAYTAEPQASYSKGSISMFGMNIDVEEYTFVNGHTKTTYTWDTLRKVFQRSETEVDDDDAAEAPKLDYEAMDITTEKEGDAYIVTVNATYEQTAAFLRIATDFLKGSESSAMLPDLDEDEEAAALKEAKYPLVFRIDESTGRLIGFMLDLNELVASTMDAVGADEELDDIDGEMSGKLELSYFDYDAVAPITAPAEYREGDDSEFSIDWDSLFSDDD